MGPRLSFFCAPLQGTLPRCSSTRILCFFLFSILPPSQYSTLSSSPPTLTYTHFHTHTHTHTHTHHTYISFYLHVPSSTYTHLHPLTRSVILHSFQRTRWWAISASWPTPPAWGFMSSCKRLSYLAQAPSPVCTPLLIYIFSHQLLISVSLSFSPPFLSDPRAPSHLPCYHAPSGNPSRWAPYAVNVTAWAYLFAALGSLLSALYYVNEPSVFAPSQEVKERERKGETERIGI